MLFVDSPQRVVRPGVYAIEQSQPRIVRGVSNGYIGVVGRFAWGPLDEGFLPESGDALLRTFEPPGSPRSSSGYYALMRRLAAPWYLVGVKGSGAQAARVQAPGTGGALEAVAKYPGQLGNSIVLSVDDPSDGTQLRRNLVVTLSHPVSGTTREVLQNVPFLGEVDVSRSRLLGSITFDQGMTDWPLKGSYTLAGGSDGAAPTAADYQRGLDALAMEDQVRVVCTDDTGDAIRSAVNAAVALHCSELARVCFVQGNPGASWTDVKADKANFASDRVSYCGTWVRVFDDAGRLVRSPLSTFAATLRTNLGVSNSVAWQDPTALKYLQSLRGIHAPFSTASFAIQDEATRLGIMLPFALPQGGFGLVHGRTTSQTEGQRFEVSRWYRDYLARSLVPALGPYVNGPNGRAQNLEIKAIVDNFLEDELRLGHLEEFSTDIDSVNSKDSLGAGDFFILVEARTPGVRERIFILLRVGETVVIEQAA